MPNNFLRKKVLTGNGKRVSAVTPMRQVAIFVTIAFCLKFELFKSLDFCPICLQLSPVNNTRKDFDLHPSRAMTDRSRRTSRRLERSPARETESPSSFNSWTVVKLRKELKRRGWNTGGLKADLVSFTPLSYFFYFCLFSS